MAHRSDTSASVAVDFSRHLELLADGLEQDVLPEEDVSPAGAAGGYQALLEGASAGLFEDIPELERERRALEWHDLAPLVGGGEDDVLADAPPLPPPPPDLEGDLVEEEAARRK